MFPQLQVPLYTLHLTHHNLPSYLHSSLYFSIFSSSLVLTLVSPGTAMSIFRHSLISLLRTMISGLLASITRSLKTLKSQNNFTLSFSLTFSALCWYHCSLCSRPCFLARPQWTAVATYHAFLWLRRFATLWNNVADCLICLFAHSTQRWCPIFLYRHSSVISPESLLLCRCYQTFCFSLKGTSLQPHPTLLWSYLFFVSFELAMHDIF